MFFYIASFHRFDYAIVQRLQLMGTMWWKRKNGYSMFNRRQLLQHRDAKCGYRAAIVMVIRYKRVHIL